MAISNGLYAEVSYAYDNVGDTGYVGGTFDPSDDATPKLGGLATAGSTVTVTDRVLIGDEYVTEVLGTVVAGPDGQWSLQIDAPLADGVHRLFATATDGVETSTPSDPVNGFPLVVDTSMVVPTFSYASDTVGEVQANLHDGAKTDDTRPTFHGMAEPSSVVQFFDGVVKLGEAMAGEDGSWSFTPHQALTNGMHTIEAVTDGGYEGGSFHIDIESGNSSGSAAGSASGHSQGEVSVPGAEASVAVPSSSALGIDYVLTATGPVMNNGHIDGAESVLLHGHAPANTIVTFWDGDTMLGGMAVGSAGIFNFSASFGNTLTNGEHHYTVRAASTGESSDSFNVSISNAYVPPPVELGIDFAISAAGQVMDNGHVDSTGSLLLQGHAPANTIVTLWDGDTKLGGVAVGSSGIFNFNVPGGALGDGEHQYTVRTALYGQSSDSFDLSIGHVAPSQAGADTHAPIGSLSIGDVLSTNEGDLFSADHVPSNTTLSVHDLDAAAAVANSVSAHDAGGVMYDASSHGTHLVLPHEHAHAVM